MRNFSQIRVEQQGDVFCIRLCHAHLDESDLQELEVEILALYNEQGARKLILNLGSEYLFCLYSLFVAKLIKLQQKLQKAKGKLVLAEVTPDIKEVFQVCGLDKVFLFYPDQASAMAAFDSIS